VSELESLLQSSLGTQYRLERELGGGGMSRVFLAEEIALGRKVVLKVLPPELTGALSPERFQREVRLAASLQHPHMVPLLAAGSAGGILYYTMPYVAGESLRARLDRQGALPVPEAFRYLRDVTEALAAAHAQGIVHRDIKPDNVLLTHQHAVVTDFGIAKAVSAAGGGGSGQLTGTGLAIGTPTYMAPEQATGDAQVDHRADLYSLGVMAYEMLAGEPPFRGPMQVMIAAHLSRIAPPLTELRPNLPPALARLVAHCLEKLPADRFGSAEELLAELDTIGASISGSTATASAPASAPAAPGEWPLPRVLAYFAIAAVAVLGLAWGLRTLLGLPDWFFPAAVILLALGLPIVVLAGISHNRRIAGGTATSTPGPGRLHHGLTLSRAIKGGIAAFSGLGLVTGAYMAMRLLGIGPVGSLVASGKLNERERLIIADFANQTRDPLLGPAVTQAFRVDFSQSKLVSPVEGDYVRRVLRRMQRPDSVPVSLDVAREIAQREGFKAVVAGELQQVGPSLLVSAQLVNAQSGEVLATARETAKDSTGILDAVDRVSKQLREKIGESLRSIRGDAPLAEVTTGSLDALRKYSQALRVQQDGDNPGAIALLEDAVGLDSSFSMAWRKLATMLTNSGVRPARAAEAFERAYALRDRLTMRERKLTEASYYSDVRGEGDSAIAALQSLLADYPNDSWAHNNLGVMFETTGREDAAEQSYRRAAELEPENILAWGNIFTLRIGAGRFDSAAATLRLIEQRFPAGPSMDMRKALLLLGRRDFAAAEDSLRVMTTRHQANAPWHDRFLNNLAGVLAIRGKVAEANRALATLAEQRRAQGDLSNALEAELARVFPIAVFREDQPAAQAVLDGLLKAYPPERMAEPERPLIGLIQAAVIVGDRGTATRMFEEFQRHRGNVPGRAWGFLREGARGQVLSMRKETLPEALAGFHKSAATCSYCVDPPMAVAFERAGMADSALVYLQRWADAGENIWEAGVYWDWAPVAYFRLGELYEARGDRTRAVDYYGRFTELWREADPEFQPKVKDIRRRIAELSAEPRRP
jgi:Flp pilus assembly protein TadD/aminoglycoside phosphotransferase (APT) family kinase protein